jgi:hypothetical protein
VLELCAVVDTLIADDEGIYDLRDPNDRLVLGLKGTLFAAEMHILQARMRAGLLGHCATWGAGAAFARRLSTAA